MLGEQSLKTRKLTLLVSFFCEGIYFSIPLERATAASLLPDLCNYSVFNLIKLLTFFAVHAQERLSRLSKMTGKKRGMSLEDKRATILNIFHESKSVFLLKDIEKIASKRGVVLQSIKDVLQSLVDDDLVHAEKIGVSNYFWSFPSEAAVKLDGEINKLKNQLTARKAEETKLNGELAKSKVGKEDSAERQTLVRQVSLLEAEVETNCLELSNYNANDPERFEALKQGASVAFDSANRWTDNVFCLQSWAGKKFGGMDLTGFFKSHGIDDSFDYVEA